jgi:hypothetical protein
MANGFSPGPVGPNPWRGPGRPGVKPQDTGAAADKQKADQAAAKAGWNLADALLSAAAGALRSSSSLEQLTQNLIQAGGGILDQLATQMLPGQLGNLLGAGVHFLWNMAFAREETLPVKDGALEVRVVNFSDLRLDFASIRDKSEISHSKRRREAWAMAAAAMRGA